MNKRQQFLTLSLLVSVVFVVLLLSTLLLTNPTKVYSIAEDLRAIKVKTSQLHREPPPENKFENSKPIGLKSNFLPVAFLEQGYLAQRAVARVVLPTGEYATGFLISPSLFITNNHVIDDLALALQSKFEFNYQLALNGTLAGMETYNASADSFYTSDVDNLDYTVIKLKDKPGEKWGYIPLYSNNYRINDNDNYTEFAPESLYGKGNGMILQIIEHPEHRAKEVVMHDCMLSSVRDQMRLFRYTCDTEPASSGSPVFDKYWHIFALHRGAGDSAIENGTNREIYLNNEGVNIHEIGSDLQAQLMKANDTKLLNELGLIKG